MKLLLTSAGITNQSVAKALQQLIGKSPSEVKVGYIPTAANAEAGNKDWYIAQLTNLQKYGYNWIDIVDIADQAVDWKSRLEDVDIIFTSGGNTFHLLNQYRISGFGEWLKDALKAKIYVGVSAGSIVMGPNINVANIPPKDKNFLNLKDLSGMNFVDFEIEPHCEGERFKTIENYASKTKKPIYAIDDQSAIKVDGSGVKVISEGAWELFNG